MLLYHLTKKRYYTLYTKDKNGTTAETTAFILLKNFCKLYNLSIFSDRWSQIISGL